MLAALALSLGASACGSSDNGDVTLTIGARGTPEEEVIGQIYAQALRAAGYQVNADLALDTEYREVPMEKLKAGRISGYPDHLNSALAQLFAVDQEDLPNDPQQAYEMAKAEFGKKQLTVLPPTPYGLSTPVVVLRKTADQRGLKTYSDLKGEAEEMTVLGPNGCFFSLACLGGIESYYRTSFEAGGYAKSKRLIENRYNLLDSGEIDALIPYSTEGPLANRSKYVILEDDKHVLPAGNTVFVTSPEVLEEAGPDLEEAIAAAQRGLNLLVIQRLDGEVELEGKDPAKVAAGYLKRVGLDEESLAAAD